jgi:hypothetical protein
MSFLTGTSTELIYQNIASGTAKASFTTEALINDTAGMGAQAQIPPYFFMPTPYGLGKTICIQACGIVSSTATPTYTFTIRLGASGTSGPIILGSAALTTASGITNKQWTIYGYVTARTLGAAGANSTLHGWGMLESPGGIASPFAGELWGGAAQPGTVTTVDFSITNYINFGVACSASSPSNSIQLLSLQLWGMN